MHLNAKGLWHIDLHGLAGDEIMVFSALPGHFMHQRNPFGLGRNHNIMLGHDLDQLPGAGHRQLHIPEDDKRRNA